MPTTGNIITNREIEDIFFRLFGLDKAPSKRQIELAGKRRPNVYIENLKSIKNIVNLTKIQSATQCKVNVLEAAEHWTKLYPDRHRKINTAFSKDLE